MDYTQAEVQKIIEEIGKNFTEARGKIENRFDGYEKELGELKNQADAIEKAVAKMQAPPGGSRWPAVRDMPNDRFAVTVDGTRIPVLGKADKLAASFPAPTEENRWSVGEFVRGSLGMKVQASVLERGTATVPQYVSARIIDLMRVKARLIQAGAITIPIEGKTHLCRIDADPTVHQHSEGTDDVSESTPTLTPVELDPKALVALVPLSMEIVQDSPNLDAALDMALAGGFASKLDTLGLATILADGDIPTSGSSEATDAWAGTLAAVGSMLAANMDIPAACICGATDFITRAGELASTAGTWLGAPPVLAKMLDLPTTSMSDGFAVLGNFELGFGIAVRQELRLEVIRFAKPTYASHILVAYARMDGYVLQPNALYNQVDTVE